jgi:hypothetical protein
MSKYKTLRVEDGDPADYMARRLIEDSRWFEFTPLPDGVYEIRVKNETGLPVYQLDCSRADWRDA